MASSKIDMALDDIIKMQRKSSKMNGSARRADGDGKSAVANRKRGPSLSLRGRRAGVSRPARKNASRRTTIERQNHGVMKKASIRSRQPVGQRTARNLVKRAMLRNRRQAITVRRSGNTDPTNSASTRRLVEQVRQWRNTAKLLHSALQIEASKNLRSPVARMNRFNRSINNSTVHNPSRNSVQNRLGWQNSSNGSRGVVRNYMTFAPEYNNQKFGTMRSDDLSRENERVKRITADVAARYGNGRRGTSTGSKFRPSFSPRRQNSPANNDFFNNFRDNRRFNNRAQSNDFNGLKSFRGNNRSGGRRMQRGRYS